MKLSNAPVSWGVYEAATAPVDAETYLRELTEAGFQGTELGPAGFMPDRPEELTRLLRQHGLALVGAVVVHDFAGPESALGAALERVAPLLSAGGATVLTVMDDGRDRDAPDAVARVARALEPASRAMRERHGLTLAFHPHVSTAVETEAQIEELLARSETDLCLDTGHHAFWGGDPAAYFARRRDRVAAIHLKNVRASLVDAVASGQLTADQAMARGVFCPLDEGTVEIHAFLDALGDFRGPVVVEQDWTPTSNDAPIALARRNARFLGQRERA